MKKCNSCQVEKEETTEYFYKTAKGRLNTKCKVCQKEYQKNYEKKRRATGWKDVRDPWYWKDWNKKKNLDPVIAKETMKRRCLKNKEIRVEEGAFKMVRELYI